MRMSRRDERRPLVDRDRADVLWTSSREGQNELGAASGGIVSTRDAAISRREQDRRAPGAKRCICVAEVPRRTSGSQYLPSDPRASTYSASLAETVYSSIP